MRTADWRTETSEARSSEESSCEHAIVGARKVEMETDRRDEKER